MKSLYPHIIICLFVLQFKYIIGQERTNFQTVNIPSAFFYGIESDNLGYVWFNNSNGLYKFIGNDFLFISYKEIFGEVFKGDRNFLLGKDDTGNLWLSSKLGELTKIDSLGHYTSYKKNLTYNGEPLIVKTMTAHGKNMWFGTENGTILKYDYEKAVIDSITSLPKFKNAFQNINSLTFSSSSDLWLSTITGHISHYNLETNTFTPLNLFPKDYSFPTTLAADKNENLWIATENVGLINYNTTTHEKTYYGKISDGNNKEKFALFYTIFCDSNGIIWAGTDGDGLFRINPESHDIQIFKHNLNNKYSISNNTVLKINEDKKGNLWFLLKKGLVNVIPKNVNNIIHYPGLDNHRQTLVLSILKSSSDDLWLGTDENGLTRITPDNKTIRYYKDFKGKHYFEGEYVQCLDEDAKGNIWIGTYKNGLWVFNSKTETFEKIITSDDSNVSTDVRDILVDSKKRIWALFTDALYVFDSNKTLLAQFQPAGYVQGTENNICQDSNGNIWLSIGKDALYKIDINDANLATSEIRNVPYFDKSEMNNLYNYSIRTMCIDYDDNLWLTTFSGFLIKYSIRDNLYKSYLNDPLFNSFHMLSSVVDDNNNLWLGTSGSGLHLFQKDQHTLKSYYSNDGFQIKYFNAKSSYKDKDGMIYFGGHEGVNAFYPDDLVQNKINAKLYINDISILNKPARHILNEQVKFNVEHTKHLTFNAKQSSFSIKFSAIDNILNTNYYYAYKLEGFDEEWISPGKDISAKYTNIPAGNYTFMVKAGTKPHSWDIAPVELGIKIKPFWWNTIPAYIVYLVIIAFLIYSYVIRKRLKSQLLKEALQNEQSKELYAMKMNFFAKMSHEIQTPLTLILGPINDMLERASANGNALLKQRLTMINNNANRLSRLATELMTVRNKELGKLRLYASKNNLTNHLKKIAISFSEQARFKKIDLIENYPDEDISIWYDKDKIEHVVYNLLSNAFKFTPKKGKIELQVRFKKKKNELAISVTDSGPGIPKSELDDIFELFYQSDLGKHTKGTGIGLALTKELIALHKGKIKVKSVPGQGSCFTFTLQTKDNVFSEDEKIYEDASESVTNSMEEDFKALEQDLSSITKTDQTQKHTLVIVEDNVEMQMFLKDVLTNSYNLFIAENGQEGIDLVKTHNPDLIISDIMMPVMDGLEMCKILQKKTATAHIPIILLTAKDTDTSKLKGLKYGAVEYLRKPFNFSELLLRIHNIIATKERAISKYKTDVITTPVETTEPSRDDIFISNLVKELNEHIVNPNFRLEDLSVALGMSYSVIYRKCQDITGKTLVEFLRTFRIKKGALLIIEQGYNISEAAFMVGYKDSKYFTKCFKEEFGIPPSVLKREVKDLGMDTLIEKYKLKLD